MLKMKRAKLGDYEIQYTTFKRNIKFTLELAQEREDLEQIDDKIGAMDDEEVGQIDLQDFGVGKNKTQGQNSIKGVSVYGQSVSDNNFVERFKREKQIE